MAYFEKSGKNNHALLIFDPKTGEVDRVTFENYKKNFSQKGITIERCDDSEKSGSLKLPEEVNRDLFDRILLQRIYDNIEKEEYLENSDEPNKFGSESTYPKKYYMKNLQMTIV